MGYFAEADSVATTFERWLLWREKWIDYEVECLIIYLDAVLALEAD